MAGGRGIEHACGGELGGWIDQPRDDQGARQIASALWRATGEQRIKVDASCCAQGGQHVTMWQSPRDLHSVARRQQALATEYGTQLFNALGRPMRQVRQGPVLGLAIVAVACTQQDRGW